MERREAIEEQMAQEQMAQEQMTQPATGAKDPEANERSIIQPAEAAEVLGTQGETVGEAEQSSPTFIHARGRIEPRFGTLDLEKEFVQATGRAAEELTGLPDREALASVLQDPANRHIVRQMCWVFTVLGLDTYILQPSDPQDFDRLVEALRPAPRATDVDVVTGIKGPLALPEMCNGLVVPYVFVDRIFSFDVASLIGALEAPAEIDQERWQTIAEELFDRVYNAAATTGESPEGRALTYISTQYQEPYHRTAAMYAQNFRLSSLVARISPLSGPRTIVDVFFTYTNRETDFEESWMCRVDATGEWLFLVQGLQPVPVTSYY